MNQQQHWRGEGVNGDGGYLVARGIKQCEGPLIHHLEGNGDKGSTSPKHGSKQTTQRTKNKGVKWVLGNQQ
jgi:hypothetical protein